jgi:lipopolysaccharide transport system ATP-binding protein
MPEIAIDTHELGKRYSLGLARRGYGTLRETLGEIVRRPFGEGTAADPGDVLWALRDLTLTIKSGEVVGLIGHNGAGKSTLLKILSRITEPSTGYADLRGRVGSLLEVGTGFHPELTGRENIYLNGSILGMRKREIRERFDEIVDFAEIERFLDTPVKRYSSGMSVRLAFAVAAHLEPEILLVDEVLAVGDAAFQRKSLGKMNEVAGEGRTVVFVSHNLAIIQALCSRGILLERGRAIADAPVNEAIDAYLRTLERAASEDLVNREDRDSRAWNQTRIRRVSIRNVGGGHPDVLVGGAPARIEVALTELLPMLECRITIVNNVGQPVATLDSEFTSPADERVASGEPQIECDLGSLPLLPGRYRLDIVVKGRRQIQDGLHAAAFFDVEPGIVGDRPMPTSGLEGDIALDYRWRLPSAE